MIVVAKSIKLSLSSSSSSSTTATTTATSTSSSWAKCYKLKAENAAGNVKTVVAKPLTTATTTKTTTAKATNIATLIFHRTCNIQVQLLAHQHVHNLQHQL